MSVVKVGFWTRLALVALLPVERYHMWVWKRAYAKGKYVRPDNDRAAITTRRAK